MDITNQVCSLEYAKQLEKLGVKQNSVWMWVKYELWDKPKLWHNDLVSDIKITCLSGKREYAYSSFTVAELGEMLKKREEEFADALPIWDKGTWTSCYLSDAIRTEANARAKILIYLLENNL